MLERKIRSGDEYAHQQGKRCQHSPENPVHRRGGNGNGKVGFELTVVRSAGDEDHLVIAALTKNVMQAVNAFLALFVHAEIVRHNGLAICLRDARCHFCVGNRLISAGEAAFNALRDRGFKLRLFAIARIGRRLPQPHAELSLRRWHVALSRARFRSQRVSGLRRFLAVILIAMRRRRLREPKHKNKAHANHERERR